MIGVLATRNNVRFKNAKHPIKYIYFTCLGQGLKQTNKHRHTQRKLI